MFSKRDLMFIGYRSYVSYQILIVVFELFHPRIYECQGKVKIPFLLVLEWEEVADYSQIRCR